MLTGGWKVKKQKVKLEVEGSEEKDSSRQNWLEVSVGGMLGMHVRWKNILNYRFYHINIVLIIEKSSNVVKQNCSYV